MVLAQAGLNHSPITFVSVIVLILDLVVIISLLAGHATTAHKTLWIVIVLLLPVLGLVLYFLLGRRRADRPLME